MWCTSSTSFVLARGLCKRKSLYNSWRLQSNKPVHRRLIYITSKDFKAKLKSPFIYKATCVFSIGFPITMSHGNTFHCPVYPFIVWGLRYETHQVTFMAYTYLLVFTLDKTDYAQIYQTDV